MRRRAVFFALWAILGWALAGCQQVPLEPKLEYQADRSVQVIVADTSSVGGWQFLGQMCNHIPDLRVWGDGRVVYSHFQDGKRVVEAGSLDPAQIQLLLQTIAGAGFFRKNTPEVPNPQGDYFTLTVHLKSGTFSYSWNSAPGFYSALTGVVARMGLPEYTPDRALLVSTPCSISHCPQGVALPEWPAGYGFSLADAEHGGWIAGEALSFVWQAVNMTFPVPGFREGNKGYGIALEIPGVSWSEPPFDCWGSMKSIMP